tara:strand:+ start:3293 stop:4057 length:765 start_codon:yes stop_codon:yes gene_type:complete
MSERDERLQNAIDRIKNLDDSMKVNLKGKKYTMVAQRVQAFREAFGCGANVETEIVVCDDTKVIVKATVSVQRDGAWVPIATEFAEEYRGVGMVNKTSALENCCTSSIGRALAACGLSGGEYASSFEVDNAINNKAEAPTSPKPKAEPKPKSEPKPDKALDEWVEQNDSPPENNLTITYDGEIKDEHADEILSLFNLIMSKSTASVDDLNKMYRDNKKLITEIQENSKATYKRLMDLFTAQKNLHLNPEGDKNE